MEVEMKLGTRVLSVKYLEYLLNICPGEDVDREVGQFIVGTL